jgi:hypothetical protein
LSTLPVRMPAALDHLTIIPILMLIFYSPFHKLSKYLLKMGLLFHMVGNPAMRHVPVFHSRKHGKLHTGQTVHKSGLLSHNWSLDAR